MNRRENFKAMNAEVIVLPKRDLKYTEWRYYQTTIGERRFEFL